MKKILVSIICCLCMGLTSYAKNDPQDFKVIAYRADGTHFEGYVTTALRNYFRPKVSTVGISETYKGEEKKYTSDEVVKIVFPANKNNTTPVVYEAVTAMTRTSMFSKMKPTKTPIFLRLIYEGENVKGYVMPYLDQTLTTNAVADWNIMTYTYTYFFMTADEGIAKPYWTDMDGVIPNLKGVIKKFLKDFPEIGEMIDKGELKPKEFRKNPSIVYPIMDDALAKRKAKK